MCPGSVGRGVDVLVGGSGDGVLVGVLVAVETGVLVFVSVGVLVAVETGVLVFVSVGRGEGVLVDVFVGVPGGSGEGVSVGGGVAVSVGCRGREGGPDREAVGRGAGEMSGSTGALVGGTGAGALVGGTGDGVLVGCGGVAVLVAVLVGALVAVFVGVPVDVLVAVFVAVFVGVPVGVPVAVLVGMPVAVLVGGSTAVGDGCVCGSTTTSSAQMFWLCAPLFWQSVIAIGIAMLIEIGIAISSANLRRKPSVAPLFRMAVSAFQMISQIGDRGVMTTPPSPRQR